MGGNLEELLSDIENLSHDIHELQIQNKRYHSEEKINYQPDILTTSVSLASVTQTNNMETKKPFRSEVNLVLSTPGNHQQQQQTQQPSHSIIKPKSPKLEHKSLKLEPIGFEPFNDDSKKNKLTKIPTLNNSSTGKIRKQYLKSPSISLNELVNSKFDNQHSKEIIQKRRSLDEIIIKPNTINEPDKATGKPTVEKSPKTKHKSKHISLFRKKKLDDINHLETNLTNDKLHNEHYHTKDGTTNLFTKHKNSNKHKKQILPIDTASNKLRRGSETKYNKKYSRLSIDSTGHFYESQDSTVDQRTSFSEKNSYSFDSSRESSASFSSRRKVSLTSHNNEKIPWFGCWGNGCF